MSAREEILGRVRSAIAASSVREVEVGYRRNWEVGDVERVERFTDRLGDYGVAVFRADGQAVVAQAAAERMRAQGIGRLLVPPGLPMSWRPASKVISIVEDTGEAPRALDTIEGVMIGCAVAIAETGSIVLDAGPAQARRAVSLVPDYCLCVVMREQVVGIVPEAIARLADSARAGRPITFISGPSATADIELRRVAGVHGPRRLEVILVG